MLMSDKNSAMKIIYYRNNQVVELSLKGPPSTRAFYLINIHKLLATIGAGQTEWPVNSHAITISTFSVAKTPPDESLIINYISILISACQINPRHHLLD